MRKLLGLFLIASTAFAIDFRPPAGGGGGTWGTITGTLSSQTDLQSALDAKQTASGTAAAAKAAAVADAINNGTTDVAPSQNAVFDALALKEDASSVAADARAAIYQPSLTKYVDKTYAGGSSDGSTARPYTTIQAALTAIGAPVDAADTKNVWTVFIAPGTYDESLTVYGRRSLNLICQGTCILGDGASGNFASTTARSITIQNDYNTWFGEPIRRFVRIGTMVTGLLSGSTHAAYHGSFLISGGITLTPVNSPVGSVNDALILVNAKVFGNIDYTTTSALPNFAFINSMVVGTVSAASTSVGFIYEITNSQIDGLITVNKINRCVNSELVAGASVGAADSSTQPPSGFFGCKIAGTFTGPANSYRVDGVTKYLSTATLAGGATEVLMEQTASSILSGIVNTSAQTFAGAKTFNDGIVIADAKDIAVNTTTGTKIGTSASQKIGFWNATPIVQPTTAGSAATFSANTSGIADDSATFDGYTIGQVVKALRNAGLLQ